MPAWIHVQQGLAYLANSVWHDPLTLGVVAVAILSALSMGTRPLGHPGGDRGVCPLRGMGRRGFHGREVLCVAVPLGRHCPGIDATLTAADVGGGSRAPVRQRDRIRWRRSRRVRRTRWGGRGGRRTASRTNEADTTGAPTCCSSTRFGRCQTTSGSGRAGAWRHRPSVCSCDRASAFWGSMPGPKSTSSTRTHSSNPLLARLPVGWDIYFDFWASHFLPPDSARLRGIAAQRQERGRRSADSRVLQPDSERHHRAPVLPLALAGHRGAQRREFPVVCRDGANESRRNRRRVSRPDTRDSSRTSGTSTASSSSVPQGGPATSSWGPVCPCRLDAMKSSGPAWLTA